MFAVTFVFVLSILQSTFSIHIGSIVNVTYHSNDSIPIRLNGTCQECICQTFVLHSLSSYVAFNCYPAENKCDLFHNYSTSYQLVTNTSSKFYFYPSLPSLTIFMNCEFSIRHNNPYYGGFLADTTVSSLSSMANNNPTTPDSFQWYWNPNGVTVAGITSSSGAAANQLSNVRGLTLFSSNILYMADKNNHRVQRWLIGALNGSTVAGLVNGTSGSALNELSGPTGTSVDSSGNVYVADSGNHRVVFWLNGASSGIVVAGNGTAGSALNQLSTPCDCAFDTNSNMLYIADTFNHRIIQYANNASFGTVVAGGNGNGYNITQLNSPKGVKFDASSNSLYIVNTASNNIVRWILNDTSWTLVTGSIFGTTGVTSTLLNGPLGIALDSMGNVYVADTNNHRIQFYFAGQSNGTTIIGTTTTAGNSPNLLNSPTSVTVDNQFNICVGDSANVRVQKFSLN